MAKQPKTKRTAARGPRGLRGRQGRPGVTPRAVSDMRMTVEQMHRDAEIQFKRIAQLQAQLDAALKSIHEMGEKVGRQRRKP